MDRLLEKATRQHTKDHNSQLVLRTIYDSNEISRAELARMTRLTRTTISEVVTHLIERGLVEEVGHGRSSGGRMPILLSVIDDSRHLIGINLLDGELSGRRSTYAAQFSSGRVVSCASGMLKACWRVPTT